VEAAAFTREVPKTLGPIGHGIRRASKTAKKALTLLAALSTSGKLRICWLTNTCDMCRRTSTFSIASYSICKAFATFCLIPQKISSALKFCALQVCWQHQTTENDHKGGLDDTRTSCRLSHCGFMLGKILESGPYHVFGDHPS
jgi:hypothetical protein